MFSSIESQIRFLLNSIPVYLRSLMTCLLPSVLIVLNLLMFYSLPVYANGLSKDDALNQAMISMNTGMSSVSMTGNSDVDFALMMIPHHQGAVEMAKVELKYGTDSRLQRLAQEIIVTQQSEIEFMQILLGHLLSTQSSSSP